MAETVAHLVDGVLPEVPIRQWVLTQPFPLRDRLAYDRRLLTSVLGAFVRAVSASLRRRAREALGVQHTKCGAVTFVQRFGGALNLNVHFHSLVLEGVYEVFPDSRGIRCSRPCLAGSACTPGSSYRPWTARGSKDSADTWGAALAAERLEQKRDGRVLYRLRHRWRDGTSGIVLEPREFLARLAAQIPPLNTHQVRYHAVLAPAAAWRPYVVARGSFEQRRSISRPARSNVPPWKRMAWSDLLRRVFAVDALVCDGCGGRMRRMATILAQQAVSRFLASVSGDGRMVAVVGTRPVPWAT